VSPLRFTLAATARPLCVALLCATLAGVTPESAAAQSAADQALKARVEAALESASDVPADSIAVQVSGGVVTLVDSVACEGCGGNATPGGAATVQQSLGAVVRAVPGVERVEFRLRYGPV
jgi:osmotically-inducible protein OsmY